MLATGLKESLMSKFKSERFLIFLLRVFLFVFSKIRCRYYSLAFNASDLVVGKNLCVTGSQNINIGNRVNLGVSTWLDAIGDGVIHIGDDVSLSQNVHIAAANRVFIDDGCLIGSNVLIADHNHSFGAGYFDVLPRDRPLEVRGETVLGKHIWLGDNVKILSGVALGSNVVVAANSVVNKSFPANVVIAGIPAKIIKIL